MYLSTDAYCDWTVTNLMCNGLRQTTWSYSGDALRYLNVQSTSQLHRDVRKRFFISRIWIPLYKYVNKGNSNVNGPFIIIIIKHTLL